MPDRSVSALVTEIEEALIAHLLNFDTRSVSITTGFRDAGDSVVYAWVPSAYYGVGPCVSGTVEESLSVLLAKIKEAVA